MSTDVTYPVRTLRSVIGYGLLRGLGLGAVLGALAGVGLSIWWAAQPGEPGVYRDPFSVFLTLYVAVIAGATGAVVGLLSSAASMAVLAVADLLRRRDRWVVSIVAAGAGAAVAALVLNAAALNADSISLSASQVVVVLSASFAVALWQVQRLVRS